MCPDQSSVIDSEADLRQLVPVNGKERGSLKVGPKHTYHEDWLDFEFATLSLMSEISIDLASRGIRSVIGRRDEMKAP